MTHSTAGVDGDWRTGVGCGRLEGEDAVVNDQVAAIGHQDADHAHLAGAGFGEGKTAEIQDRIIVAKVPANGAADGCITGQGDTLESVLLTDDAGDDGAIAVDTCA